MRTEEGNELNRLIATGEVSRIEGKWLRQAMNRDMTLEQAMAESERTETTKEWALEARVDAASFAIEATFRRGYGAGWAGRSNAEDDADYVMGYEFGMDDRREADADSRIA
jgi:hypothetical protein